MGYPVIGDDTELPFLLKKGICNAVMGIGHVGYPKVRNSVYKQTLEIGFSFPNLIHPTAVIADTVEMGEGSLFAAQCVVNADAKIGTLCIVNTLAVIEHEVNIGDCTTCNGFRSGFGWTEFLYRGRKHCIAGGSCREKLYHRSRECCAA